MIDQIVRINTGIATLNDLQAFRDKVERESGDFQVLVESLKDNKDNEEMSPDEFMKSLRAMVIASQRLASLLQTFERKMMAIKPSRRIES